MKNFFPAETYNISYLMFVNTEEGEWSRRETRKYLVTEYAGNLREAFDLRANPRDIQFALRESVASFHDISMKFSRLFSKHPPASVYTMRSSPYNLPSLPIFLLLLLARFYLAQLRENFRANICRQLCGAHDDAWVVLGFRAANRGQGGVLRRAEPRRCIALHLQPMLRQDPDL